MGDMVVFSPEEVDRIAHKSVWMVPEDDDALA